MHILGCSLLMMVRSRHPWRPKNHTSKGEKPPQFQRLPKSFHLHTAATASGLHQDGVWIGSSGPRSQVLYWFLPCRAQTTPRPLISVRLVLEPPRPQRSRRLSAFFPARRTPTWQQAVVVSPPRRIDQKKKNGDVSFHVQTVPVI